MLRADSWNSIVGICSVNDEFSTSLPENFLEMADGLTSPNANELGLAARIGQEHLASEKQVKLIQPNIALDESSFTVDVMALASRRPIQCVFVEGIHCLDDSIADSMSFSRQSPSLAIKVRRQRQPKQFQNRRRHIHNRRLLFNELVAGE